MSTEPPRTGRYADPTDEVDSSKAVVLAGIVAGSASGISVLEDGRFVYANRAACELLARSLSDLRGRSIIDMVQAEQRADLLPRLTTRSNSEAERFRIALLDSTGRELEVMCSTFAAHSDGPACVVAMFWELSSSPAAARTATALAQTAAQLVAAEATLNEILADIARHAFEGSRATSAGIVVMGADGRLDSGGGYGGGGANFGDASLAWNALNAWPAEDVIEALGIGNIVVNNSPGGPVVISDARAMWLASPVLHDFADTMKDDDWKGAVCVPLSREAKVIGVLGVYLPSTVTEPTEDEIAFFAALADQASMAVSNVRLTAAAGRGAALRERARLARELHDSVSQGLFSMTMQARAAQLSITRLGLPSDTPLSTSVAALADLSRAALADMRALIFELRPGALAEEGLVGALRKQAAALSAREGVSITVESAAERAPMPADAEEHTYRIVSEALNNVAKHAGARTGHVLIERLPGQISVTVTDDGHGFDSGVIHPGHLGLSTMRERASIIGATLAISSSAGGGGTTVTLTVPLRDDT
jgi:PAS domain S-box-containing protein